MNEALLKTEMESKEHLVFLSIPSMVGGDPALRGRNIPDESDGQQQLITAQPSPAPPNLYH